mmetsp:Transcript_22059/g.71023  ORF Transcript_22059/g.71023 Transcript_22059/m.71023 type:complete len:189 (-) Transcript_22059:71-637(-)
MSYRATTTFKKATTRGCRGSPSSASSTGGPTSSSSGATGRSTMISSSTWKRIPTKARTSPPRRKKKTNEKVVEGLDSKLRSVVDYATVAHDVAQYNFDSLEAWIAKVGDGWQSEMHKPGLRWDVPFDVFLDEAFDAIDAFRHANDPRRIYPCRNASSAHPLPSQGQGGKKRTPLLLEKKRQKVTASRT